nr:hypothetical protein [Tanacetum cinerariifolium]
MSTLVFVDPEISTQADGTQSPRVPVPFFEDPYEAIRQVYLVGTNTESEPFKDPVETEAPDSPHTVAPPTSLPNSTPPNLVPVETKRGLNSLQVADRALHYFMCTIYLAHFIFVATLSSHKGPALNDMIPGTISSGLVQKPSSYVPPSRNDWDLLFQPLFDELLNPPPRVDDQDVEVIAPIAEVIPQVDDDSTCNAPLRKEDVMS